MGSDGPPFRTSARICLVTTEHVSINPRIVKEADALAEYGYDVTVIACQWQEWATRADLDLLASRPWRVRIIDYSQSSNRVLFWYSRLRHYLVRRFLAPLSLAMGAEPSLGRVISELNVAARSCPADLYVGHNLGALPAVVKAARKYSARVGFDAEDFHSGMLQKGNTTSTLNRSIEYIEARYLKACDYITAASPGIAKAYAEKYQIARPHTILNVFPLAERQQDLTSTPKDAPLTMYWFSQWIGSDRGLEDIVRAMGALQDARMELHLRGNWQRGYRERLLHLAETVGVKPNQILAHPVGAPEQMVALASQYDIGLALEQPLSVNRDLCLTNKIFTYLLAGNAIIATSTMGQTPIMEAIGCAGFCYQPGDFGALVRQLRAWRDNRALLIQARRTAWDLGTKRYNWDLEKGNFLELVNSTLAANG